MTLERAISREPIVEKMRNVREYVPLEVDIIYGFAVDLADRLDRTRYPELTPEGFYTKASLLLSDYQKEEYPPALCGWLRTYIPKIAEAVCPEDFAKGVRELYEEINVKMILRREEKSY